jgi:hypothetical protein
VLRDHDCSPGHGFRDLSEGGRLPWSANAT